MPSSWDAAWKSPLLEDLLNQITRVWLTKLLIFSNSGQEMTRYMPADFVSPEPKESLKDEVYVGGWHRTVMSSTGRPALPSNSNGKLTTRSHRELTLPLIITFSSAEISVTTTYQVGSGPAGLYLALCLLKTGIKVRIIEKDKAFHNGSRGAGIYVCFSVMDVSRHEFNANGFTASPVRWK